MTRGRTDIYIFYSLIVLIKVLINFYFIHKIFNVYSWGKIKTMLLYYVIFFFFACMRWRVLYLKDKRPTLGGRRVSVYYVPHYSDSRKFIKIQPFTLLLMGSIWFVLAWTRQPKNSSLHNYSHWAHSKRLPCFYTMAQSWKHQNHFP